LLQLSAAFWISDLLWILSCISFRLPICNCPTSTYVSMWLSLIHQTCPPIWTGLLEAIFQCWWLGCVPGFLSGEYKYSWSKLVRDKVISKSSVHEKGNPSHIPRYILKVIIPKEMDIEPSIHTIYQNLLQSFFILILRKFSLIFLFNNVLLPYVSVATKLYMC
jgi:hypothetical protein